MCLEFRDELLERGNKSKFDSGAKSKSIKRFCFVKGTNGNGIMTKEYKYVRTPFLELQTAV